MRELVIEAFALPRAIIRDSIELDHCPHSGNYDPADVRCQDCDMGEDCSWLCNNDEIVQLEKRTVDRLLTELEFAQDYVNAQVAYHEHPQQECSCAACSWLRNVRMLNDKIKKLGIS
ncbi:MAG: hypothetical protein OEY38_12810 [Gammaproteobacteria bacterium]|nr:hypothetical protein [Gammaproteobacteria bacterium]